MKATYKGFNAQRTSGFTGLPPVGAYVAEILEVRYLDPKKPENNVKRDTIELFMEIVEGEYANRFHEVYEEQTEKWGNDVKYKAIFRLIPPSDDDADDWRKRTFEGNLWCVQQSNPGYAWDWDEKKLKGKKVGISIRRRLYTYNGRDRETVEIGRFETIDDVKAGKVKPMRDKDNRTSESPVESTDGSEFTNVSNEVEVPWG